MKDDRQGYDDKSALGMMAEVGRLLLVLLLKYIVRALRIVKRALWWGVKLACKGLLCLIDATDACLLALSRFWNDHSTQEKLRRVRWGLSVAWQATLAGSSWLAVHTWHGLRWLARHIGRGCKWLAVHGAQGVWLFCRGVAWSVVHLRGALALTGRGIARAGTWVWHGTCSLADAVCQRMKRLYRAWVHFRRTKGFKGLLIDFGLWLRQAINDLMEEQDGPTAETTSSVQPDDEPLPDDEPERFFDNDLTDNDTQRVHIFGQRFYRALRHIVEDD